MHTKVAGNDDLVTGYVENITCISKARDVAELCSTVVLWWLMQVVLHTLFVTGKSFKAFFS